MNATTQNSNVNKTAHWNTKILLSTGLDTTQHGTGGSSLNSNGTALNLNFMQAGKWNEIKRLWKKQLKEHLFGGTTLKTTPDVKYK